MVCSATVNFLVFLLCFVGLSLTVPLNGSNVLKAVFEPKTISSHINSSAVVSISLLWTETEPSSHAATLETSCGHVNPLEVVQFNFDKDWKAHVPLELSKTGRFVYFVKLLNESQSVEVQGAVIINVFYRTWANTLANIVGWTYFLLWSVSFYPQVCLNHMRKSVVGLSIDFTTINLIGFLSYSLFNCLMYIPGPVQAIYLLKYPHSPIPVEINDVAFSVHAFLLCSIIGVQCLIFERGDQRLTKLGIVFLASVSIALVIVLVVWLTGLATVLSFVYAFSYVKLASSLVKYVPQAYLNFKRKSTTGWSIGNIFLDFSGGLFNFLQQFILSLNFGSWNVLYGNPAKLALGITSIVFDIMFIVQHYILYPEYEIIAT